jgi:hypothetical protein
LVFDDVSITIPCTGLGSAPNAPTVSMALNTQTVCAGQPITATVTTANNNSPPFTNTVITIAPNVLSITPFALYASATSTLTGCISITTVIVNVSPRPFGYVTASSLIACAGQSVSLTAFGSANDQVVWSTGQTGTLIAVSPTVKTAYSLTLTNQYGCSSTASTSIFVYPLPPVGIIATKTLLCVGDEAMLTGAGAYIYQWLGFSTSKSIAVSPTINSTYTVIGVSVDGCFDSTTVDLAVMDCVGINNMNLHSEGIYFYPNPVSSSFVMLGVTEDCGVYIYDQHGKLVHESSSRAGIPIDVSVLARGIYIAKIKSAGWEKSLKVIKE